MRSSNIFMKLLLFIVSSSLYHATNSVNKKELRKSVKDALCCSYQDNALMLDPTIHAQKDAQNNKNLQEDLFPLYQTILCGATIEENQKKLDEFCIHWELKKIDVHAYLDQ